MSGKKLIIGDILNPISDKKCEYIPNGGLLLRLKKNNWVIDEILTHKKVLDFKDKIDCVDYSGHLIMPGFYDMHFHWVQKDVCSMPKNNLLKWLDNFTFPTEKKFGNKKYCIQQAKEFSQILLKNGTIGGACYGSIHEHSVEFAQKYFHGHFVIGNVLMTMNSPRFLTQKISDAKKLIKKLSIKYKSRYAVTPRFAPTTDPETMRFGAQMLKKHKTFMQTHLSETKNEIEWVKSIYDDFEGFSKKDSYTEIYNKVGLLGKRSLFGHGIHLEKSEYKLLSASQSVIVHCPTSNAPLSQKGLGSGLFDFKRCEKEKVRWALGSDIGAGPHLSMFDVIRSYVFQNQQANVKGATYTKGLYRATQMGADILEVGKTKGNFLKGKDADFIVIARKRTWNGANAEELLGQISKSYSRNRSQYQNLVNAVFLKGKKLI